MEAQKKLIFRGVNLRLKSPVETLNPDRLNELSKEDLAAYLYFYDIETSLTDSKPLLKKQMRTLIASIKDGTTPRREGIGCDLRRTDPVKHVGSLAVQNVISSMKTPTSLQSPPTSSQPTSGRAVFPSTSAQASISKQTGPWTSSTTPHQPPKHFNVVDYGNIAEKPSILDEGVDFQVFDLVAPITSQKLEKAFPSIQNRSLPSYQSLIDRLEHMEPSSRLVLPSRVSDRGSLHLARDYMCSICNKRAVRSCRYKRCANCCASHSAALASQAHSNFYLGQGVHTSANRESEWNGEAMVACEIHTLGQKEEWAALPRPLERNGTATVLSSHISSASRREKRQPPTIPKSAHVVLGETEATNAWAELREESLFRASQNSQLMETLFDHQPISFLARSLQNWKSIPLDLRIQDASDTDAERLRLENLMASWTQRKQLFEARYRILTASASDEESEAERKVRADVWLELDGRIPVPLVARKRLASDTPDFESMQPESKKRAK